MKNIIALSFCVFCLSGVVSCGLYNKSTAINDSPSFLYHDLIHDNFKKLNIDKSLNFWLAVIVLLTIRYGNKTAILLICTLIFFSLRTVSMVLTFFPSPNKKCDIKPQSPWFYITGTCFDTISGHTFLMTLCSFQLLNPLLAFFNCTLYAFLTSVARAHYSADCFWGMIIAVMMSVQIKKNL